MPLTPILIALFVFAGVCALIALGHAAGARRRWRERRRFACGHRLLWSLVFLVLTLASALAGFALLGYRRLTAEAPVASLTTRAIGPQRYAVRIDYPDGEHRSTELSGDQWQLDARVIKWDPRAVVLGAPTLYRVERLSGRYRDVATEREAPRSVVDLAPERPLAVLDAWNLKQRFPRWMPWLDADYGSAAYLPLVDGGRFEVSLAPAGGLVARPGDAATAEKLEAANW
jgi:hypothetical protein